MKRFDRDGKNRIHYISAITALRTRDGQSSEFSYLDLVGFIRNNSNEPLDELKELYKRMVLTYLLNKTDNHLRNNAFLLKGNSYTLSPMFDVSPSLNEGHFALKFYLRDSKKHLRVRKILCFKRGRSGKNL